MYVTAALVNRKRRQTRSYPRVELIAFALNKYPRVNEMHPKS